MGTVIFEYAPGIQNSAGTGGSDRPSSTVPSNGHFFGTVDAEYRTLYDS